VAVRNVKSFFPKLRSFSFSWTDTQPQIQIRIYGYRYRYRCAVAEQNFRLEICQPLMALFDAISSTPIDGGLGTGDWGLRTGQQGGAGGRAPSETRPTGCDGCSGCSDRSSLGILRLNSEFAFSIKLDCDGCSLSAAKERRSEQHQSRAFVLIRIPNRASSER